MALHFLKKHGFDLSDEVEKINFGSNMKPKPALVEHDEGNEDEKALKSIIGVRLPNRPYLWDVHLSRGKISALTPHDFNSPISKNNNQILEARGCLLAPSLCHAHIHLDKCFLLQDPKFSDLQIVDGDFKEAMTLTSKAKARFTRADLLRRGRQLIVESVQAGVTAIRAFCELDGIVGTKCLDAGLELKREFKDKCDVQICAFAQLPAFSGDHGGAEVRRLMEDVAGMADVEVLGSTPYVEDDEAKEAQNLAWIVDLALNKGKMLDLHLDYNMDANKRPLIWNVFQVLKDRDWRNRGNMQITLGHCTRLTHFDETDWSKVREGVAEIPLSFVGLPTSDLFMMRTEQGYRGTLNVPTLIQRHALNAAISVNNVGNAFTPQGNCDPLSVASLGVGLYSAGTKADTELLFDCVSWRAKSAIGIANSSTLNLSKGDAADFVIFEKSYTKMRTRKSIVEVVYDPPGARIVVKNGIIISR